MMNAKNQDENITNIHGDHVASCLCCRRFSGDMGDSGYSEYTPASLGYINCDAGEFYFNQDSNFYQILNVIHSTARHCKLFLVREDETN